MDEEIGTNQCFQADPDDLVRHIMGFGKGELYIFIHSKSGNFHGS